MASVKDTATFFAKGTSSQFEHVLKLYPQALRLRADKKTKKPEELIKLDNWYQNELPKKIKSRGKDAHLIHEELVQTMKWKQTRGKFYPQLSYLVKVNTPRAVMIETKKAFRKLPNLEQAITALSNLKGVGTTMASALLAAAAPDQAPFMADECLMAIPEIEGIDYTTKEYLNFVQHIQSTVERLNKETGAWSPHQVELALWTHYVASELKPELLDSIPDPADPAGPAENGTANAHYDQKNGESDLKDGEQSSDESTRDSASGKHPADGAADDTASFTEDSMDKPATPATLAANNANGAMEPSAAAGVDENTNDSAASTPNCSGGEGEAVEAAAAEQDVTSCSLEGPPAKKTKMEDEQEEK